MKATSYIQDSYTQLHNLTQGSMSVDEYTREFEKTPNLSAISKSQKNKL